MKKSEKGFNKQRVEGKGLVSLSRIMDRYLYSEETRSIIKSEGLLPEPLLERLHACYPRHSGIMETAPFIFTGKQRYSGKSGFREIVEILRNQGIEIGHIEERELFIDVYRFMASRHVLNKINWKDYEKDSLYQLVIPQPGMMKPEVVKRYSEAKTDEEKERVVREYQRETNPHDGKQLLNKPWFINEEGDLEILTGSQHKYPPCQLIFDKTTQSCFTFCTYCFRHAQVRGDEDMFVQEEIHQVHQYLRIHKEVTDVLITGGDAGYLPLERLIAYVDPIIEDPDLRHIKTLRLGSRALTFHPEMILSRSYESYLEVFKKLYDHGIQVVWMAHFSTPREILNPSAIAAIRRLKAHGVAIRSQSPIMSHISLFKDKNGKVDIEKSAQNWIDLGLVMGMLSINFHSMYCARPTGEHHYFAAPLADILKIFNRVYRELPSICRPSRFITMTASAGKISLIGTLTVSGRKAFVLKFNEGRNMEWMDETYLAEYDEKEITIERLKPFDSEKFFYEDELADIEQTLSDYLEKKSKEKLKI